MKEIKAYIHRNRIADVVHGLEDAGFSDVSTVDVKGMLRALSSKEQEYSIALGDKCITEIKLELVCDDERTDEAVAIIRKEGRTGQRLAGKVFVSDIVFAYTIDGN